MRVFILGAGFSKPAGFPLTIKLTEILLTRIKNELGRDHEPLIAVESVLRAHEWAHRDGTTGDARVDAEELFFMIEQAAEAARASQHFCLAGR